MYLGVDMDKAEQYLRMHNLVLQSIETIRISGNAGCETDRQLKVIEQKLLALSVISLEPFVRID